MNITAKEFKPKSYPSYPLPKTLMKQDSDYFSYGEPNTSNQIKKAEWVYWSKNIFTNIVIFFDLPENAIYKLLRVSKRMRGAVLCLVPRIKMETYQAAPSHI